MGGSSGATSDGTAGTGPAGGTLLEWRSWRTRVGGVPAGEGAGYQPGIPAHPQPQRAVCLGAGKRPPMQRINRTRLPERRVGSWQLACASAPGREAAWTVRAIFAVEAADESEARGTGNQVLRQMDAKLAGPPARPPVP
jgi:hypothetical protein